MYESSLFYLRSNDEGLNVVSTVNTFEMTNNDASGDVNRGVLKKVTVINLSVQCRMAKLK